MTYTCWRHREFQSAGKCVAGWRWHHTSSSRWRLHLHRHASVLWVIFALAQCSIQRAWKNINVRFPKLTRPSMETNPQNIKGQFKTKTSLNPRLKKPILGSWVRPCERNKLCCRGLCTRNKEIRNNIRSMDMRGQSGIRGCKSRGFFVCKHLCDSPSWTEHILRR